MDFFWIFLVFLDFFWIFGFLKFFVWLFLDFCILFKVTKVITGNQNLLKFSTTKILGRRPKPSAGARSSGPYLLVVNKVEWRTQNSRFCCHNVTDLQFSLRCWFADTNKQPNRQTNRQARINRPVQWNYESNKSSSETGKGDVKVVKFLVT